MWHLNDFLPSAYGPYAFHDHILHLLFNWSEIERSEASGNVTGSKFVSRRCTPILSRLPIDLFGPYVSDASR